MDVINRGAARAISPSIGLGNSELDDYATDAAAEQKRTLRPDAEPEKGFYYRSDHFNFAKQGVPAFDPEAGVEFIGKPAGYGKQKRDEYTAKDYHQPSGRDQADWDLSGAVPRSRPVPRDRLSRRERDEVPRVEAGQRVQGET